MVLSVGECVVDFVYGVCYVVKCCFDVWYCEFCDVGFGVYWMCEFWFFVDLEVEVEFYCVGNC